jgi:hypothetical protein
LERSVISHLNPGSVARYAGLGRLFGSRKDSVHSTSANLGGSLPIK